jgi:hypothetical protein
VQVVYASKWLHVFLSIVAQRNRLPKFYGGQRWQGIATGRLTA